MKKVDYILVGCGLAGIAFCEQLRTAKKTFVVFDDASQHSSTVAGGLYNPVVLKRFTPVWKSKEQLEIALPFYKKLEEEFNIQLDYKAPVRRLFNSIEEQNNWFAASDKKGLSNFLAATILTNTNTSINAPFGFGEVLDTGRVDTSSLVMHYRDYLASKEQFEASGFLYENLIANETGFVYGAYHTKKIVFSEGFGITKNSFFNYLPLKPTKGELLTIYAPKLQIDYVLKSSVFIIPLGDDLYRVGATYEWEDTSHTITQTARKILVDKLKSFITCDFKIVNQTAGIRPAVSDRRPLLGAHTTHENMYVLNGLGTRGVMIAPYVAQALFNHIEHHSILDPEMDIQRFSK